MPDIPEPQGCAAALEKVHEHGKEEQQSKDSAGTALQGSHTQPGQAASYRDMNGSASQQQAVLASAHSMPKSQEPAGEAEAGEEEDESAAVAPHPLLSMAGPMAQAAEALDDDQSSSQHPLMQVGQPSHAYPLIAWSCLKIEHEACRPSIEFDDSGILWLKHCAH